MKAVFTLASKISPSVVFVDEVCKCLILSSSLFLLASITFPCRVFPYGSLLPIPAFLFLFFSFSLIMMDIG